MILTVFISKVFIIAKTLAFSGSLSIVYSLFLQLKHFRSFMSHDISSSKFRDVRVIVSQSVLDKRKKVVLLFNKLETREEPVIALKGTLAIICTIVRDLIVSLIRSIAYICS